MSQVTTNLGKAFIVNALGGTNGSFGTTPGFLGWGTGSSPANTASNAVSGETSSTAGGTGRIAVALSTSMTAVAGDTLVATATMTADNDKSVGITNIGLFDSATAGSLLFQSDFSPLPISTGDTITFIIRIFFT